MSTFKHIGTKVYTNPNLIGDKYHRAYLQLQAESGISQRGGSRYPFVTEKHHKRLISDVNILTSSENNQLIFSEYIFCN